MNSRYSLQTLRAALWAERALRHARRDLQRKSLSSLTVLPPPALPRFAGRGVLAVLRRRSRSCLETALVLQSWRTSQGDDREIVIGVSNAASTFKAHAWLDGDPDPLAASFQELLRVPSKGPIWDSGA